MTRWRASATQRLRVRQYRIPAFGGVRQHGCLPTGGQDRIWHAGSVVATTLATTTFTGQPSALGRFPDGAGVGTEIWIEINAAVSATPTTVAVDYTNSAGTAGRTTGATATLASYITGRLIQMPSRQAMSACRRSTL